MPIPFSSGAFLESLISLRHIGFLFRNFSSIVLKAMMLRTADHLRVGQRFRALLSTLIEEWGVNTFERGVNFRPVDLAYPESGLDKCGLHHFSPRSSSCFLPIVRLAIMFHVPSLLEAAP